MYVAAVVGARLADCVLVGNNALAGKNFRGSNRRDAAGVAANGDWILRPGRDGAAQFCRTLDRELYRACIAVLICRLARGVGAIQSAVRSATVHGGNSHGGLVARGRGENN